MRLKKFKINKIKLPAGMSKMLWRARDFVVDNSPAICTGTGIGMMLIGAVKILCDSGKNAKLLTDLEVAKEAEKQYRYKIDKTETIIELVKTNALSAGLEASGAALILTGFSIQARWLSRSAMVVTGLTEAYNALYSKYEEAVGKEEAKNSLVDKWKLIEMTGKQDSDGNEIVNEQTVNEVSAAARYGFIFGPMNKNWEPNCMAANWAFARGIQDIARYRFNTRERLIWNEVRTAFDEEETQDGMVVGWSMKSNGDHCIDLGIDELFAKWQDGIVTDEDLAGGIPIIPNVDGLVMKYYPKA